MKSISKCCGHPDCSVSSGIHGGLTFGHGKLDSQGFWEFPCRACAEQYDKDRELRAQRIYEETLCKYGASVAYRQIVAADWVFMPAWPGAEMGAENER